MADRHGGQSVHAMVVINYALRIILGVAELSWCGMMVYDLVFHAMQVAVVKIVRLAFATIFGAVVLVFMAMHPPK